MMRLVFGVMCAVLIVSLPQALAADTSASPTASDADGQSIIGYPASTFISMGLDTAYDAVLRVPGFVFDDGSNVRGFASAAGNVLIDGARPASKTDDLISILKRVPISAVERIDLIRGGAPGIDMQGKTVVVNVIHKKTSGFNGVVAAGAYKPVGLPFDPQLRLEGHWEGDGRILEASLFAARFHNGSEANGPHAIFASNGQLVDSSAMRNIYPSFQYLGTAAYEAPVFGGKLRVNLTLEDQPNQKLAIDDFKVAGLEFERDRQDVVDAELGQHYERSLSSAWDLEVLGLEHLNKTDTVSLFETLTDHQNFAQDNHGGEIIGRGILHWRPAGNVTVDAGGEFAYNWLQTQTIFSDNGLAIVVPAANVFVSEKRGEAFATAVWRPLESLAFETGLRIEASTISSSGDVVLEKTLAFPKPRLVATWTPDSADQVRLRVEREVGQLDFADFSANAALNATGIAAGNPNLSPQRDWTFEASYDRHFWTDGVVSLTLRHLLLQDIVDRVPVFTSSSVFDEPGNIGSGRENDIIASFNLPLQRLGLEGAALRGVGTWRFSQVKDPTTGQRREISLQHPLDAEIHFAQDFPKWNLSWGVDFYPAFHQRNFRFNEIDRTDNAIEESVYVDYKPKPDLALRFQADDLERLNYVASRQVFVGPRGTNRLEFTDVRRHHFGPIVFVRIRKTFS